MDYEQLKEIVKKYKSEGHSLPCSAENENGEYVIITEGEDSGIHFIELYTCQENDVGRINTYYEDGTITETYDVPAERKHKHEIER